MSKKPSYLLHKPTGQARVRIDGKDHYLGSYDSELSKERYDDLIAEWLLKQGDPAALTIDDLVIQYMAHARQHYQKDDAPTSEVNCIIQALRPLILHYGTTLCRKFGPKALKKVREKMVDAGLVRSSINSHVKRIRRMFKWATSEELCPVTVHQALCTVQGLQAGRTTAKEGRPVKPVAQVMIDAVKPFVSRHVWGMIELQLVTGMRPGEVVQMRGVDLTTVGKVWEYIPESHKTEHHGKTRTIFLGPKAKRIVQKFLKPDLQTHLFDPRDARKEFIRGRYRDGAAVGSKGQRFPGECYSVEAYETAVRRACERAHGMPVHLRRIDKKLPDAERQELKRQAAEWRREWCWHPNQLRHNAGTELRRQFDLDAARTVLGHASSSTTEIYAERDRELAREVIGKVG